VRYFMLVHMYT